MWIRSVFAFALLASLGCADAHQQRPPGHRIERAYARIQCACAEESGYDSAEACIARLDAELEDTRCAEEALAPLTDELGPTLDCWAEHVERAADCYEAATCDAAAAEPCQVILDEAGDVCPEASAAYEAYARSLGSCQVGVAAGCPAVDLGAAEGQRVLESSTRYAGDDVSVELTDGPSPDQTIAWRAPRAGRWRFALRPLGALATMFALDACDGPIREPADGSWDWMVHDLAAGEELLIVVESPGDGAGPFDLSITQE